MKLCPHPSPLPQGEGVSRRHLLMGSAALALAAATLARAAEPVDFPIIDAHQHLWDLDKFTLPWLKGGGKLAQSFVTKDYLAAVAGQSVGKAVYMEVDVAPKQHVAEAEYVLGLTNDPKNLTAAAVIGGRPAEEGFAAYVKRFENEPKIIGVRQVLHGDAPQGFCTSPGFIRGVQTLGKFGKTFDLCMRPTDLGDAVKLVDACPDTKFVLDHCGNGSIAAFQKATRDDKAIDQYKRDIAALAKRDRVICKISGIVVQLADKQWTAADLAPVINTCLDAFGPDRVIWASDWPVCTMAATLKQWITAAKEVVSERPLAEQKKLFHDNAQKFYRL